MKNFQKAFNGIEIDTNFFFHLWEITVNIYFWVKIFNDYMSKFIIKIKIFDSQKSKSYTYIGT